MVRQQFARSSGLQHAPVLENMMTPAPLADVLAAATGPGLNSPLREGIVLKSTTRNGRSFKVISNEFLLKHGDS